MANKRTVEPSADPETTRDVQETSGPADSTDKPEETQVDQSPEVRSAAEAVGRAKAELRKAQEVYQRVRQEATDRLQDVRQKTVGDLIDGLLGTVKKFPGPSVIAALLAGFFLGRIFRK